MDAESALHCHGHASGDGDPTADLHSNHHAYPRSWGECYLYRHAHLTPDRDTHLASNDNADPHRHDASYRDQHGDRHRHRFTKCYAHCHSYTDIHGHTNTDWHLDSDLDAHADSDAESHRYRYTDPNLDADRYREYYFELGERLRRTDRDASRLRSSNSPASEPHEEEFVKKRRLKLELSEEQQLILGVTLVILLAISMLYCLGFAGMALQQIWQDSPLPWQDSGLPTESPGLPTVTLSEPTATGTASP